MNLNDLSNPWYIGGAIILIIFLFRKKGETISRKSHRYQTECQGTDQDIEQLLADGRKIEAIKLYREIHGVGLKEARDAIEQLCSISS